MTSPCGAAPRAWTWLALLVTSAASLALGACVGQADPGTASMGALGASAAELDRDVFLPGCAFGACHGASRPAAQLNLGAGICGAQRDGPSCLFPSKRLIVPGHPEQSFLMDKLTGENLTAPPETDCSTTGNARMPYGGAALSSETIERVRTWIAAGAPCPTTTAPAGAGGSSGAGGNGLGSAPGGGAGSDENRGAGGGTGWRLGFDTPTTHVRAGARTTITLTIVPAPGPQGVSVALSLDDPTALGVPGAVFVPGPAAPAASAQVSFDVQGKRPSPAVRLTATAGDARIETIIAVDGLFITQVFYGGTPVASPGDHSQWVKIVNVTDAPIDLVGYQISAGRAGATDTVLPLSGVLQPATCRVVGGAAAGDFVPDIPRVDPNQPPVTVALAPTSQASGSTSPALLDAVAAGGTATLLASAVTSLAPGHALVRTGPSTWSELAKPNADACPRWW